MPNNTTVSNLTAVGANALSSNTTGTDNVAVGYNALLRNTQGDSNIAIGNATLNANTTVTSNDVSLAQSKVGQTVNGTNLREDVTVDGRCRLLRQNEGPRN